MEFKMDFSGKTAIATGAASGMGLLFCQCFAAAGGNVVMTDINMEALEPLVAEINGKDGGRAIGLKCDVRDYEQVCAVRDAALEAFGRVDVMLNTAGGAEMRMLNVSGEFPDVPIDVYDWSLEVNLRGQFYCAHAVMKPMREQKSGLIINVGSITGAEGDGGNVGYSTSKSAAMYGLTKSLAQYGARYGIRCVCVSPGPVLTRPGMAGMKTMLGRAAEPQEIIDLMLYLCSDHGAFINGENIMIDGGRNAMRRQS